MAKTTRRVFLGSAAIGAAGLAASWGGEGAAASGIESIEPLGMLIGDCTLPGERRQDDVVPAHPNGIRVSRDCWLLIYATRGFRGVDDDRSIVYQLRRGSFEGKVIKEGFLVRSIDDWDAEGDGKKYVRQHGHPVVFGVPKGAKIKGRPAGNANVFVAKWRLVARKLDRARNYLEHTSVDWDLAYRTQSVEWVQFRLNAGETDIEIIQPAQRLRERGFERGPRFSRLPLGINLNQSFTQAVPVTPDATEWADVNHCGRKQAEASEGGLIVHRYGFDPAKSCYEWVETGPILRDSRRGLSEASLAPWGNSWVVAARSDDPQGRVAWLKLRSLTERAHTPFYPAEPRLGSPLTAYMCNDGVLRLFAGSKLLSPYQNGRDPLYCWEIDPDRDFAASGPRVIFDSVKSGLRIRPGSAPKVDMCKVLPGPERTQLLVYRVSVRSFNFPYVGRSGLPEKTIPLVNEEEKVACGIYAATITFRKEKHEPLWSF